MTDNRDAHTEQIAATINAHAYTYPDSFCECGQWFENPWDEHAAHVAEALLPVVARIKADAEQATNDAYTLGYIKGREQAAEVVAAVEPILTYLEGIEDFFGDEEFADVIDCVDGSSNSPALTFTDLRNLRAALSAGRTALNTQLAQARAEAWDRGYRSGVADAFTSLDHDGTQPARLNPYRAEASGEGQ